MAVVDKPSARETKRLQTRERLMGAAIAEFKRSGIAAADVGAIVTAAGVAHGTFFFHFPTKEHVLLELERREEERIAKQLGRYRGLAARPSATLEEAVRLVRRPGTAARALCCSKTFWHCIFRRHGRRGREQEHPVIVTVAREIERAPGTRSGRCRREPDEQRGVLPVGPLRAADNDARLAGPGRRCSTTTWPERCAASGPSSRLTCSDD